jgi:4a-hydroxytetrahydrobiopterin dehydratase
MALMSSDQIDQALRDGLPGWGREGDALVRSVEAPSFMDGIELVRRVAEQAEENNHHPDIDIRWTTVTFRVSTHSEGGITTNDIALAHDIDRLAD